MNFYKSSLLAVMLLFFGAVKIFADCPAYGTPTEELKRADAVFSGKVIGTERRKVTNQASEDFGGEQLFIKLKVDRWWKGDGDEEMTLRTSTVYFPNSRKEFAEDFQFSIGETYLVYAFLFNDAFATSACTRTKKLSEADKDLMELGEGFPPSPKKSRTQKRRIGFVVLI
jgi:hypothetical protein